MVDTCTFPTTSLAGKKCSEFLWARSPISLPPWRNLMMFRRTLRELTRSWLSDFQTHCFFRWPLPIVQSLFEFFNSPRSKKKPPFRIPSRKNFTGNSQRGRTKSSRLTHFLGRRKAHLQVLRSIKGSSFLRWSVERGSHVSIGAKFLT